jgi:hypothetical protein
MNASDEKAPQGGKRRRWEVPVLKPVGAVSEVIAGGGGKLSPTADDTGDTRKPKGLS